MRSPSNMQTIQIDITNACDKRCSNCTRFCGNHRKSFFMNFDTFKRAADSLDGYDGVTGVMGGEPTLHPEFERFVLYLLEKFGVRKEPNRLIAPQREFIKEIRRREFESHIVTEKDNQKQFKMFGPGLWSNMGASYRRYYELINDSFNVQFLNDHINSSYHQPGLFSRKDLGIPDDAWIKIRDACWVQNEWSATITPKGAFFCEIAGALDMLFDGPGGWKIESGWWKRTPQEFGDQLQWCELCGFALNTFMRDAEEETDDASPTLYKMLEDVSSPRLKAGRTNLVKIENGVIAKESKAAGQHFSAAQPYIEHYEDRFNEANSVLFVRDFDLIVIDGKADKVTDAQFMNKFTITGGKGFGAELNKVLAQCGEWIAVRSADAEFAADFVKQMGNYILNPGTMHYLNGFTALFCKNALSLREFGFDRIAHVSSFVEIVDMWQQNKVIELSGLLSDMTKWKRDKIIAGAKYAIWGTGLSGSFIADAVQSSGGNMVLAVDKDYLKHGKDFYGATIQPPECLSKYADKFDYVIIGHYSRFNEIKQNALALGIDNDKILMPFEI